MAVNTEHTRANVLQDCATWPAQARARWLALFDPDDPIRLQRWARMQESPWVRQTQYQKASVYTRYLATVRARGLPDTVAPDGVLAFIEAHEARVRADTLAGYLKELKAIAELLDPGQDNAYAWLGRIRHAIAADAERQPKVKTANLMRFTVEDLHRVGVELIHEALEEGPKGWPQIQAFRNGLCIMLGIMCPERPRAWANLRLDHVKLDTRRVHFPGEHVKTKNANERPLPALEALLCELWLTRYRAHYAPTHDRFWIARGGQPPVQATLYAAITRVTRERLGVAVSPQRFRDAAATFITSEMPERENLATLVLRHASPAMTRKYTTTANQLTASLQLAEVLDAAHRDLRAATR
jgi:integrase